MICLLTVDSFTSYRVDKILRNVDEDLVASLIASNVKPYATICLVIWIFITFSYLILLNNFILSFLFVLRLLLLGIGFIMLFKEFSSNNNAY